MVGPLLQEAYKDESNDARIVKIRAHMWKIWPVENHKWMKIEK
jgi:hypothetical protein